MTIEPLKGSQLVWATIALGMGVFMIVLDSTIANVALPTIAGNLGASLSQGTWVITSFAVASAVSIPLTGWLAKRFGEVKVFLYSTFFFAISSFLCGIAQSLEALILFRVLQGASAGPLAPLSQSLLMVCYPPLKRGMALGVWSMLVVIAPVCGPILGGWISDNWHWGWIFFINVPIGIFVILGTMKALHGRETPIIKKPVDKVGLFLLVVGVSALQIMLDKGKDEGWFNSSLIITLACISIVCLVYLVIWDTEHENPIIDLSLFKERNFSIGVLSMTLAFMVYFGTVVLLPLVLQTQLGYTALRAGLAMAPIGILPVILLPIIGKYAHRLDMRVLVTFSFTVYALCFLWRTVFNTGITFSQVFWPQFVQGLGTATFFMPLIAICMSGRKPSDMASASALVNFMRTIAGAIGTSFVTTLWDRREALHHSQLTQNINPYNPVFNQWASQLSHIGMTFDEQKTLFARMITQQSYIMSSNEVFYISAGLMLLLIIIVWWAKPPFDSTTETGVIE